MIAASIAAAAASSGFRVVNDNTKADSLKRSSSVEFEMENAEIVQQSLARDGKISIEKNGVRVTFSRDGRGRFKTCVDGHLPKDQLRDIGEQLSGMVIQQYVYARLSKELAEQGFITLQEEEMADRSIHMHVRRHEV
jgi:hypothetical protein